MLSISCIKSLPKTKILPVLLFACLELLKSAPKIMTFLPYFPHGCAKLPLESNPIPYPEYLYLSISAFFVNLTAPNKQSCKVKLIFLGLEISL